MIKLGDNNVTLKLGDNDVSKVYLGENQIYPSAPATNLVMQRISATEYLVTGDSGTADLTFTRESDSFVDAKGVQSLPYTFTHTAGEKWSVNGVNAWGVEFSSNTYATGNFAVIPQLDSFEVGFYQASLNALSYTLTVEYGTAGGNYKSLIGSSADKFGIYATTDQRRDFTTFRPNQYNHYKHDSTGQYLNGEQKNAATVITHTQNDFFTLGRRRNQPTLGLFTGIMSYLKISGEEFKMNEGQGTEIIGSNGNSFTLINPTWVTI